jgi:hypothetical protein
MKTFGTDSSLAMSRQGSMQSDRKDIFRGSTACQEDKRIEDMVPLFEAPSNDDIL